MKKIEKKVMEKNRTTLERCAFKYLVYDQLAMAAAINRNIIVDSMEVFGSVELEGKWTRGQMVWDWNSTTKNKKNINLITKVDMDIFEKLIYQGLQKT